MIEHQCHLLRQERMAELLHALPPSVVDYSEIHWVDCHYRLEDQAATGSEQMPANSK